MTAAGAHGPNIDLRRPIFNNRVGRPFAPLMRTEVAMDALSRFGLVAVTAPTLAACPLRSERHQFEDCDFDATPAKRKYHAGFAAQDKVSSLSGTSRSTGGH